jgi:hypothetical protein
MKKFGFGKKSGDDGGEDANRAALFGNRSKNSPAPASNPYAQPQAAADPYTQDNNKYAGMGRPYAEPRPSYGSGNPTAQGGGYGGMGGGDKYADSNKYGGGSGGYSSDRYGSGVGYGADRYGGANEGGAGSRYGPGGYGGMGKPSNTATQEADREALFGGANRRAQQTSQPPENGQAGGGYGAPVSGAYGEQSGGYGAYGEERQLTAEEEEEEDINATKQQIRFMKREDVSSTRNALQMAAQAEETGRSTLERLGAQGERIHNTERNLDLAASHNRVAEERAKELKTLNKSMFAVHVSNPFTSATRRAARDQEVIDKHRAEREQRDATREAAYGSKSRMDTAFKDMDGGRGLGKPKTNLAERAKYQFEADSEDEEMENEIDANLDALSGAASRLNAIARATGKEVDEQN